jgi:hypothetical protein
MEMELLFELPTAEESREIAKKAFDNGLREELKDFGNTVRDCIINDFHNGKSESSIYVYKYDYQYIDFDNTEIRDLIKYNIEYFNYFCKINDSNDTSYLGNPEIEIIVSLNPIVKQL